MIENQNAVETQEPEKLPDNIDDLDRLVQSRADKLNAASGKKIAILQGEIAKLRSEIMSREEIRAAEMTEKENAIAEREKALIDNENRFTAIKAIKDAGLDDGSTNALDIIDFVMGKDEKEIKQNVDKFAKIMNAAVEKEVAKIFSQHDRTLPKGGLYSGDINDPIRDIMGLNRKE